MTKFLFYRGHDAEPQKALEKALAQAAQLFEAYPTLVVQLIGLNHSGPCWDADLRVSALQEERAEDVRPRHKGGAELNLDPKDPEHAKSGNPNEWRPAGMKHDLPPAAFRFGNAALAGTLPDLPFAEMNIPGYELSRASEPELRKIMMELEERRRLEIEKHFIPEPE
jgi:hypothetical protein